MPTSFAANQHRRCTPRHTTTRNRKRADADPMGLLVRQRHEDYPKKAATRGEKPGVRGIEIGSGLHIAGKSAGKAA